MLLFEKSLIQNNNHSKITRNTIKWYIGKGKQGYKSDVIQNKHRWIGFESKQILGSAPTAFRLADNIA